jgi:predicted nucleic acid-binding OB-fold protein
MTFFDWIMDSILDNKETAFLEIFQDAQPFCTVKIHIFLALLLSQIEAALFDSDL